MPMHRALMTGALLILTLTGTHATAQEQPEWEALDRVMVEGLDSAQAWRQRWSLFFAATASYGAFTAATADDEAKKYDGRVRAITSTLGLLDTIFKVPPHLPAYRDHHAIDRDAPDALARARRNARDLAQAEQSRVGWRGRVGSGR